jgi:arabinose-5-phosphate isomerase
MKKDIIKQEGLNVLNDEIKAIENSKNSINDDFAEAVIKISNANKVIVSGVGKSGNIGRKISSTLSSVGISSVFIHPVEALHSDLVMIQKEDVAILLSKSGSTEELIKFCRKRLITYKVPQKIVFVERLEMTGSGKKRRN